MTDSYNQPSINFNQDPALLEEMSYDYREVQGVVPAGITATPHGLKVPQSVRLSRVAFFSVVAPGVGESTIIRIFRTRSAPFFSFTSMITPFTLDAASFPGAGVQLDISDRIIAGIALDASRDTLAISWQHAGPQVMQPLNVNWNTNCIWPTWEEIIEPTTPSPIAWPPS